MCSPTGQSSAKTKAFPIFMLRVALRLAMPAKQKDLRLACSCQHLRKVKWRSPSIGASNWFWPRIATCKIEGSDVCSLPLFHLKGWTVLFAKDLCMACLRFLSSNWWLAQIPVISRASLRPARATRIGEHIYIWECKCVFPIMDFKYWDTPYDCNAQERPDDGYEPQIGQIDWCTPKELSQDWNLLEGVIVELKACECFKLELEGELTNFSIKNLIKTKNLFLFSFLVKVKFKNLWPTKKTKTQAAKRKLNQTIFLLLTKVRRATQTTESHKLLLLQKVR